MDYSDGTMTQAESTDRLFSEFFLNIKAALHRIHHCGESRSLGAEERHLRGRLQHTDAAVRAALLDDFDTPLALTLLGGLLKDCNKYLDRERGEGVASLCGATLESVAQYVTSMMRVFGLTADSSKGGKEIGFGGDNSVCFGGAEASKEQLLGPLLDVLTRFRTSVRLAAMKGEMQSILALGDGVRDNELPELGVRVEDQGGQEVWKLVDPAELKKEKAQKLAAKEAKEKQKAEAAAKQAEREAKARVPPQEMFIKLTDQYSKFDEQGIPTHDKAGEPLPKNALKKLQKEWEKQKEAYEKLIAKAAASPPDASSIKS
jgi:cysteinyl-tRNA synthetase